MFSVSILLFPSLSVLSIIFPPITAKSNDIIHTCLDQVHAENSKDVWFLNSTQAEAKYGSIGTWEFCPGTNLNHFFYSRYGFDEDLSRWKTGSITSMSWMFLGASSFNGDLVGWDVGRVTSMSQMFRGASAFNRDISSWDVGSVTSTLQTFMRASSFNGDLSEWDVSRVTSMYQMFYGASSFDGELSRWDVSQVMSMGYMFFEAISFNGEISGWNVGKVTSMYKMFSGATSFNQCLGWDARYAHTKDMFDEVTKGKISNDCPIKKSISSTAKVMETELTSEPIQLTVTPTSSPKIREYPKNYTMHSENEVDTTLKPSILQATKELTHNNLTSNRIHPMQSNIISTIISNRTENTNYDSMQMPYLPRTPEFTPLRRDKRNNANAPDDNLRKNSISPTAEVMETELTSEAIQLTVTPTSSLTKREYSKNDMVHSENEAEKTLKPSILEVTKELTHHNRMHSMQSNVLSTIVPNGKENMSHHSTQGPYLPRGPEFTPLRRDKRSNVNAHDDNLMTYNAGRDAEITSNGRTGFFLICSAGVFLLITGGRQVTMRARRS